MHFLSDRQKRLAIIFFIVLGALLLLIAAGSGASRFIGMITAHAAQNRIAGEWTAELGT
jgi:hypothetical protein